MDHADDYLNLFLQYVTFRNVLVGNLEHVMSTYNDEQQNKCSININSITGFFNALVIVEHFIGMFYRGC